MKEKLQSIKDEALRAIEAADVPEKLNDVRVKFLGKKGELTAVLKSMKDRNHAQHKEVCGLCRIRPYVIFRNISSHI